MKGKKPKISADEERAIIKDMESYVKGEEYKAQRDELSKVTIDVKCKSEGQKTMVNEIKSKEVSIISGIAGTGKTYLACAQALKLLKTNAKYEKIILIKSVTVVPEEEIGFLKGTWEEKMEPYMRSFFSNFEKIIGKAELARMRAAGIIEVWPLAFIRGSNIDNSITIIDEAQNITKRTMKTILTRVGKDSKMIFLGDTDQCDMKNPKDSALEFYVTKFKDFDPFGIVHLSADDEVRNPLIGKYLQKLAEIENDAVQTQ